MTLPWKRAAKEYRAAARFAAGVYRRREARIRALRARCEALEATLEHLWVGAEQRSQSHVDVAIACRVALGAEPSYIDVLLAREEADSRVRSDKMAGDDTG